MDHESVPVSWREILFFVLKIGAVAMAMAAVSWAAAHYAFLWYQ
jgi:hypothetical protein